MIVHMIYQHAARRNIRRRVGGAVLQNSTVAMYITVYYHQSVRRSRRGRVLCYANHCVLLIFIIN